jgi:hypothetical protein
MFYTEYVQSAQFRQGSFWIAYDLEVRIIWFKLYNDDFSYSSLTSFIYNLRINEVIHVSFTLHTQ